LHMVQLMPLPPYHLHNGSAFLVPAYSGCPEKEAIQWVCVWSHYESSMLSVLLF